MTTRPLVINATAIGARKDGITTYGVHLLRGLWQRREGRAATVVLTEAARTAFGDDPPPPSARIEWVSDRIAASHGTRGNLRRWLAANVLAVRRRDALVFALSQIEAPIAGSRGVVMVHDMIPWRFRAAHPRQYHFYRHLLGPALRRALAVVTPSEATRADVCRFYGIPRERVHVIPHGSPVPLASGPRPRRPDDRYILWIGRPDPAKNLPALVDAFRRLQGHVDVRLVIAGDGSDRDSGTGTVAFGALERITVLGAVSETEKIALLDGASVLVCPSLHEGFGFTPLEAMARGCPVIAAGCGAIPEVCGDAALYADPRRPDQIADALRRVLGRRGLAESLVERGRVRSQMRSWDASVRAHLALLARCARRDAAGRSAPRLRSEPPVRADAFS